MFSKNLRIASKLAAALALLPQMGAALSCTPMGPGDVYQILSGEEASFVVLEGRVEFDMASLPQPGEETPKLVPAWFTGLMLGTRSFDQRLEGEIDLEAHCLGEWCGAMQSGERYLMFARQDEDRLLVTVEPCASFTFTAADGAAGDVVLQCHLGGVCKSELEVILPEGLNSGD